MAKQYSSFFNTINSFVSVSDFLLPRVIRITLFCRVFGKARQHPSMLTRMLFHTTPSLPSPCSTTVFKVNLDRRRLSVKNWLTKSQNCRMRFELEGDWGPVRPSLRADEPGTKWLRGKPAAERDTRPRLRRSRHLDAKRLCFRKS